VRKCDEKIVRSYEERKRDKRTWRKNSESDARNNDELTCDRSMVFSRYSGFLHQ
jgi:hypothetical protein